MIYFVAALIGAVVCTVCDHLHATQGVLWYPHPSLWAQAWWVPLLFGVATVVAVWGAGAVRRSLGGRVVAPTGAQLTADGLALVGAYVMTSFTHARPTVTLLVLVAWWATRVIGRAPAWVVAYSLLVAVGGPLSEAFFSGLGLFYYHHPDALGVGRWLPGLYLHVGLLATSVESAITASRAGGSSQIGSSASSAA